MGELPAAIGLAVLFLICMAVLPSIERLLPARSVFAASVKYRRDYRPQTDQMVSFLRARHLVIAEDSIAVTYDKGCYKMEFIVTANASASLSAMDFVANELPHLPDVVSFTLAQSSRG